MSAPAASVIVPTTGPERLARLLDSLAGQTVEHQTIVVDNGSPGHAVAELCARHPGVEALRREQNEGYSRACNLGVARADGDAVVLVNDDCVCDPGFVERIVAPLDPARGIVMTAGVMRDWRDPSRIDSAGMELDRTLLVFDYLNGEPLSRLEEGVEDPIGPSGAAAAFDRQSFLSVRGFDERLFAYWEDVDLVLRLRRLGLRCALAAGALGTHEHSATLGSGSARKNYLMGFGRGYVLRKWGVMGPRRAAAVLARETVLCAGQMLVDRNAAGIRGRLAGYGSVVASEPYPSEIEGASRAPGALADLGRRARRRARLRAPARAAPGGDRAGALAIFHLAETSGPSRSLEAELAWLARRLPLRVVLPGTGRVSTALGDGAEVIPMSYETLTLPSGIRGLAASSRRLARDVRAFRAMIRRERPELVLAVTSMLPAVLIAARAERTPALVYCGEIFDRGYGGGPLRALSGRLLASFTGGLADGVIACSDAVRRQFTGARLEVLRTVYPPVGEDQTTGAGVRFRDRHGISPNAPLLASVGYLTAGRGQDVLLRAMPTVLARVPEARCVIAGGPFPRAQDIAYRDRLEALARELGVAAQVVFAGHVEPAADVFAAADVIVNPARFNEPFGRVAFEAAVAGTPAVVTRVGAVPELLRDRESALIVPPEDPGRLGAAIAELLSDRAFAAELVAGARRVVDSRLRPEHSLAGFRAAVEALIGEHPATDPDPAPPPAALRG